MQIRARVASATFAPLELVSSTRMCGLAPSDWKLKYCAVDAPRLKVKVRVGRVAILRLPSLLDDGN